MTDLIERLRAFVACDGGDLADVEAAAAEIERLRAELGDLPEAQAMLLTQLKETRAELAAIKAQEPVAYCNGDALLSFKCGNELPLKLSEIRDGFYKTPLYAAPPAPSDEQIDAITRSWFGAKLMGAGVQMYRMYARTVLATRETP